MNQADDDILHWYEDATKREEQGQGVFDAITNVVYSGKKAKHDRVNGKMSATYKQIQEILWRNQPNGLELNLIRSMYHPLERDNFCGACNIHFESYVEISAHVHSEAHLQMLESVAAGRTVMVIYDLCDKKKQH